MRRAVIFTLALLIAGGAHAREADLDRWFDRELIPYVTQALVTLPRFKGETVMFVVLTDSGPAAVSNELAVSLRDRLLAATLDTDGVRVGRGQGGSPGTIDAALDCTRGDVHYYIGLALKRTLDGRYEVSVRALDLEDDSWVSGFAKSWSGRLNSVEQRALNRQATDQTFLGNRDVPFSAAQSDLLAARLAYELSCGLLRQTGGEYVIAPPTDDADVDDALEGTLQLIGNNIAQHSAVEISADSARVNAELFARAYPIDGALYQYWLTVTPTEGSESLSTLSASAYVLLPDVRLAAAPDTPTEPSVRGHDQVAARPASVSVPNGGEIGLIGPLRVVTPGSVRQCESEHAFLHATTQWTRDGRCSLLEARAHGDAVVFVLEHQPQLGLVRLGGNDCRERTTARIVRRDGALRFPIAWFRDDSGTSRVVDEWLRSPRLDTYYAVAVSDERAARRFANLIDKLPMRCGSASRVGLNGHRLDVWLDDFAALAARSAAHIDWRALQLKDVY